MAGAKTTVRERPTFRPEPAQSAPSGAPALVRLTVPAEQASPAHALQQMLIDGWEEHDQAAIARWPLGLSLTAAIAASLALWGLIVWGAGRIFA